jgi:dihydrofolate reductase
VAGINDKLILISAMTRARVIGKDQALPWNIPEEYAAFLGHVRGHPVIMGRTSYEIFGPDLPDSPLIVVSRTLTTVAGAEVCSDVASAVERALSHGKPVFSAGGATIYRQTLPLADAMYLSFIKKDHAGDTYFPAWNETEWEIASTTDHELYEFRIYRRGQA